MNKDKKEKTSTVAENPLEKIFGITKGKLKRSAQGIKDENRADEFKDEK